MRIVFKKQLEVCLPNNKDNHREKLH